MNFFDAGPKLDAGGDENHEINFHWPKGAVGTERLTHRNLTHSSSAGKPGDQFSPNAPPRTTPTPLTTYT